MATESGAWMAVVDELALPWAACGGAAPALWPTAVRPGVTEHGRRPRAVSRPDRGGYPKLRNRQMHRGAAGDALIH